jgi:hypothetical protein
MTSTTQSTSGEILDRYPCAHAADCQRSAGYFVVEMSGSRSRKEGSSERTGASILCLNVDQAPAIIRQPKQPRPRLEKLGDLH